MGNKMLIDAAHPEETRVVVLRGNRIEEFDFEAANKKQLRGNIYLAKVTRVEPSLQAAFIEYGGNRHGFLAFSEIHPDYYQIPVADRQALLADEARSAEEDEEEPRGGQGGAKNGEGGQNGHRRSRRHRRGGHGSAEKRAAHGDSTVSSDAEPALEEALIENTDEPEAPEAFAVRDGEEAQVAGEAPAFVDADEGVDEADVSEPALDRDTAGEVEDAPQRDVAPEHAVMAEGDTGAFEASPEAAAPEVEGQDADHAEAPEDAGHDDHEPNGSETHEDEVVEQLGGDALEDVPHRVSRPRRNYKIQEVIKRRQVLLVQVVKEERGNKGAALTTYLSLAGRYSVLMPNTARGGGISRKIVDPEDRKRLKAIAQELEVPEGMGIILRTAGAARGMPEVKRDFEYLLRMWETVRETTLSSSAPTLVYEEGSLIKRSIRDLFTKDVDEVVVAGEDAYREAKDFMRLLMPNQVRNVLPWRDPQPIFAKAGAEAQLDAMFSNQVTLKSGGYLVINQTEALVAIDVNSGRSTREHNIEDTALRTNLEAADEVARQLRLRDLAGLIVVDFIDMEEGRNDRAVERRIKDALKNDRARIQIGRISHFGLLEMSRQRMRTGVLEGSTVMCPHCAGSGTVRSVSSQALHVLRLLEDTLIRSAAYNLIARTRAEVAIYILNQKRANLLTLEARFGVSITVLADPAMTGMVYHAIDRGAEATPPQFLPFQPGAPALAEEEPEEAFEEPIEELDGVVEEADATEQGEEASAQGAAAEGAGAEGRRRRRRRRRRGGRDGQGGEQGGEQLEAAGGDGEGGETEVEELTDIESGFLPEDVPPPVATEAPDAPLDATPIETATDQVATPVEVDGLPVEPTEAPRGETLEPSVEAEPAEVAEAPRRRRPSRRTRAAAAEAPANPEASTEEPVAPARRSRRRKTAAPEMPLDFDAVAPAAAVAEEAPAEAARSSDDAPVSEPELPLTGAAIDVPPAATAEVSVPEAQPLAAEPANSEPEAIDPDRPKRSGWWQRAKATFSTGS